MRSSSDEQDPWWGVPQIAEATGESVWLVRRSLRDPDEANRIYGAGNWSAQASVLSKKRVYRARRSAVLRLTARAADATGK